MLVGNKTPPGDQVFLRVVGVDGAFVADADWLQFIPPSANDWRDTALVDANNGGLDWIVLTNGTKAIELRRDATNHFWRMIRPFPARADTERITDALQRLQTARVTQFVTDDPKADLAAFGLQPADLDLWLGRGTNFVSAIHVGKSPTNDPTQVFAKREGWNAIMTTAKEPLSPWRGSVNDFRDSHLLELTAPVAEIEVHGPDNFTLQRQGSNDWQIVGEKFPADAENAQLFIKSLAGLRVAEFVKDVVTAPDLPAYGLATPTRQITLRSAAGDTNSVIVQLSFGTNQNNEVFVRRADEDFVYARDGGRFQPAARNRPGNFASAEFGISPRATWRKSPSTKTARRGKSSTTARTNGRSRPVRKASSTRRPSRKPRTGSANWPPPAGSGAT